MKKTAINKDNPEKKHRKSAHSTNPLNTLLDENNILLMDIFDEVEQGFLLLDCNFMIVQINLFAARLFSADIDELTGKYFWNDKWQFHGENCVPFTRFDIAQKLAKSNFGKVETELMISSTDSRNYTWVKMIFHPVKRVSLNNETAYYILVQDISEYKKLEIELKQRLELEKVVTLISTRFTRINNDTFNDQIEQALKEIGTLSMVDRSYVFLYHDDRITMSNTHEWCNDGVTPEKMNLQDLPVNIFPWWIRQLENNQTIYFHDISKMPEDAIAEREILEAQSILSILVVPISDSGNTIGFMGFDSVKNHKAWKEADIRLLRLVAEIFGNALKNIELIKQIQKHTNELEEIVEIRTSEKNTLIALNNSIVENTDVIIITTDREGNIKTSNPKAEKLFSMDQVRNIGWKNFTSLIPEEDLNDLRKKITSKNLPVPENDFDMIIQASALFAPEPVECTLMDHNKRIFYVLLTLSPVYLQSEEISHYIAIATDITYRKEAEKALLLQNAAFESFSYPLVITDVNGLVVWANQSYEEMSGYSRAEIINRKVGTAQKSGFHDDHFYKMMWQTILRGEIWKGEIINRKKDGELYTEEMTITPVKGENGIIVNFISIKIDITEKKKNAEIQKELHQINEAILNNVPDLLFRIDRTGTYLSSYTRDDKNFLVPREIFIGRNMMDILPPDLAKQSFGMLTRAFETKTIVSYDYKLHISDQLRHFENRIIVISENEALSVIRDITEMRESEEKLRIALAQLNTLINNLQSGILFEDASRKVVLANNPYCNMFQISSSSEELTGTNRIELAKRNSKMLVNPGYFYHSILNITENERSVKTTELMFTSGRIIEREFIPVTHDNTLIGYLWQHKDITERKKNENYALLQRDLGFELAVSSRIEEVLKSVITSALRIGRVDAAGIYLLNDENLNLELIEHQGFSNEFIKKVKTYTPDTEQYKFILQGNSIYQSAGEIAGNKDLFYPEKIKMTGFFPIRHDQKIIGTLNVASGSEKQLTEYERITLESMVSQVGGALSRIKSQESLLLSKENFQLMFNTIDDFMFILDSEGKIIKTNPVVVKRLGYAENELAGMHVIEVHPPERREEAAMIVKQMLDGEKKVCPVPLCAKDGSQIHVETKVVKGKWDGKDALYGISRDVSERKKYEISLIESLKKEKELNEMKSRFVSMTSHEFRTPLSTILATAETLHNYMNRLSDEEKIKKIQKIINNVIFLRNVMEKIMNLENIESGKVTFNPVRTQIIPFISSLLNEYFSQLETNHRFSFDQGDESIFAHIDQQMIKQVFTNLLSNAIKYSDNGSEIKIRIVRQHKMVRIYISDSGIGIPEKDLKNILNPFFRGSNVRNIHGTGLGLALSNKFIVLHGGNLEFESLPGKGTTVCISLQIAF